MISLSRIWESALPVSASACFDNCSARMRSPLTVVNAALAEFRLLSTREALSPRSTIRSFCAKSTSFFSDSTRRCFCIGNCSSRNSSAYLRLVGTPIEVHLDEPFGDGIGEPLSVDGAGADKADPYDARILDRPDDDASHDGTYRRLLTLGDARGVVAVASRASRVLSPPPASRAPSSSLVTVATFMGAVTFVTVSGTIVHAW